MRRKLSVWTEWAWAEGRLGTPAKKQLWCELVFELLHARYASKNEFTYRRFLFKKRALKEIQGTVESVQKRLSYGARTSREFSQARRERLRTSDEIAELQSEFTASDILRARHV